MTRFPTETRQIQGIDGPQYEIMGDCAAPDCEMLGAERHHLFSRGLMGGAYDWVRLPEGDEIANLVGLCNFHHRQVTENKVRITLRDGVFLWNDKYPLTHQPPKLNGKREVLETIPATETNRGVCVTCKRPLPRPKVKNPTEEKKPRKTWSCAIPYDKQEDGADVIDSLLDACEDLMDKHGLNWGHGNRVIYYKLTTILGLFAQHGDQILRDY